MIKVTSSGTISGDAASSVTFYFKYIAVFIYNATIYSSSSGISDNSRTSKALIISSTSVISCTSSTSSAPSTTAASNVKKKSSRFSSIDYFRIAMENEEFF